MPLLVSPIDNKTPMQQLHYRGVEIDRCPVSGGVWLDSGELEKLLNTVQAAVKEDRVEYQSYTAAHPKPHHAPPHGGHHSYKHHDDYDDYYYKKHKKKSAMRELFDIFD